MRKIINLNYCQLLPIMGLILLLTGCQPEQDVMKPAVSKLVSDAKAARDAGDLPTASCRLNSALVLLPEDAAILENLAVVETQQNLMTEAVGHYEKVLAIQPQNIDALYGLALAYKQLAKKTVSGPEKPTAGQLNDAKLQWQKAGQQAEAFLQYAKPDDTGREEMTALQQEAQSH